MTVTVIVNADFYTGTSVLWDKALVVSQGRIVGFVPSDALPAESEVVDVGGCCVCAGLMDLQVNGAGGIACADIASEEDVARIARALAKTGTVRWAPTLLSCGAKETREIGRILLGAGLDKGVIGVHLEGPLLNPVRAGCHPVSRLAGPTPEYFEAVVGLAASMPVILTLAPEVVPPELLSLLVESPNLKLMLAHSTATYEAAAAFFASGGHGITHAFNTMAGISAREPGPVPASLAYEGKYVSIVADGRHVHPGTLSMLKRASRPDAVFLVSDLMDCPTTSELTEVAEAPRLAGSRSPLFRNIAYCVQTVGVPMDEALRMGTLYPARFLGIGEHFGRLAPGYVADLIGFRNQFDLAFVMRAGEVLSSNA